VKPDPLDASQLTPLALQRNNYYPFGAGIKSLETIVSPKNEYLYNGKELQEETGLYDYGARFYDPVIARWTSVDPLAEDFHHVTPYNYGMNNPILMIDPDGMAADTGILLKEVVIRAAPKRESVNGFWGNVSYYWNKVYTMVIFTRRMVMR
jgi:RHS repeat-associated protein